LGTCDQWWDNKATNQSNGFIGLKTLEVDDLEIVSIFLTCYHLEEITVGSLTQDSLDWFFEWLKTSESDVKWPPLHFSGKLDGTYDCL
jgi:hypothetical protein